jgi:type IX secretion system PorP/SprF family membrane protein
MKNLIQTRYSNQKMKLISRINRFFATVLLVSAAIVAKSQNEPIIAHFMYHAHVFNPAVAGNSRDIFIGALARQQWVGFKEAPSTQLLNAYGYVPHIKGGVGFVMIHDMLGKERTISARLSYAYSQRLAAGKAYVSAGASLGLLNRSVRGSELIYQQDADQSSFTENISRFKPYFALGLEFTGWNATVGFSVTHLDQSQKDATVFKVPRHYMAYAKYQWEINSRFTLSPSFFVRSSVFITQAEVNINATFRKRIVAGLLYRSRDGAGALLGVHIWKGLFASYSYDFNFGRLINLQTGSHEVNLSYTIRQKKPASPYYKSQRYMN